MRMINIRGEAGYSGCYYRNRISRSALDCSVLLGALVLINESPGSVIIYTPPTIFAALLNDPHFTSKDAIAWCVNNGISDPEEIVAVEQLFAWKGARQPCQVRVIEEITSEMKKCRRDAYRLFRNKGIVHHRIFRGARTKHPRPGGV